MSKWTEEMCENAAPIETCMYCGTSYFPWEKHECKHEDLVAIGAVRLKVELREYPGPYGISSKQLVFLGHDGKNKLSPVVGHEYTPETIDLLEEAIRASYGSLVAYRQNY